ncbi:MAG: [acyl-carrier-protein] S-malonyltransferase [Tistrella sp.]|mgnify:FL=1|uniref:Malonyl CoA-acyl carrier protein transacylase n=1 Tax=Tistrella mobilis TaxID=171437 RepID=A0A3B9IFJ4_9PROT|nr:ACP S-malonyltransferase [Tistrella sp.]MAD39612.1 [acyl-carrier-protein] S-malonyltransferase [Tistrella sp.]MBA74167.1 [acyl-carrier-protein] S-malonyltransferase [Tistrella sp.]HAE46468.1 [acyl-carrier-protein] S-malonyltransferase [Tistrella mobilis]
MARAFVFPGQGSQKVGMGQDLAAAFAAAREVFEEVDEALKQPLTRLMFEGPAEQLILTENAQPAIMACSMAVVRVLEREGGVDLAQKAAFVAGHSLGEYSALCAAGALDIGDTARLLKIRGQAMQMAVPVGQGAMLALMGVDPDEARAIADEAAGSGEVCVAANDNAPGQVVLSGHKTAIDRAVEVAKARGKRAIPLEVSAPFHCPLMQPAAERMADALAQVEIDAPRLPLIANVLAAPVSDPDRIRGLLVEQVTGMVRWRESVLAMKEAGVEETVELGAGKVLSGLTKRIDRALSAQSVGTPAEIEAFLKSL